MGDCGKAAGYSACDWSDGQVKLIVRIFVLMVLRIGEYDVTCGQHTAFLNAIAKTNPL